MRKGVDLEFVIAFGKNFAEKRKSKKITQEELAFKIEMSLSQIARIETAKICPSIDTVRKLAVGIDTPIKDLFDFD